MTDRGRKEILDPRLNQAWTGEAGNGTPGASVIPMLMNPKKWDKTTVLALPGTSGNYTKVPDVNLLDTRQAGFHNVPIGNPLNPEDRYEDWGHGGATDDQTFGTDSPLLFRPQDLSTDQSLYLTGKAGNYASSPDVNLLDADTAHLEQSTGQWSASGGGLSVVPESKAFYGDNALERTFTTAGSYFLNMGAPNAFAASAGKEYTAAIFVHNVTGTFSVTPYMDFHDGTPTLLGGGPGPTVVATPDGAWVTVTATAPVGTVGARVYLHVQSAAANDVIRVSAAVLREGVDATFVPSTRITGDFEVVAQFTPEGDPNESDGLVNIQNAFRLIRVGADEAQIGYWTGSAWRSFSASGLDFVNYEKVTLRARVSDANDSVDIEYSPSHDLTFSDAVSVYSYNGSQPPSYAPAWGYPVLWGARDTAASDASCFHGQLHHAEIRDGFGGPVVAQFDADDLSSSRKNLVGGSVSSGGAPSGGWLWSYNGSSVPTNHLVSGTGTPSPFAIRSYYPADGARTYALTLARWDTTKVFKGDDVSVSFWCKNDGPASVNLGVRLSRSDAQNTLIADSFTIPNDGTWREYSFSGTALLDPEQANRVYFSPIPASSEQDLSFAAVQVERSATPTPYVFPHGSGADSETGKPVAYYEGTNAESLGAGIKGGTTSKGFLLPGSTGNYAEAAEANLLDSHQSTFHNNDSATVFHPEDRYEDWGHGGATDDQTLGADSPLLFRPQDLGTEQSLYLTGLSGNYASSPDVNLLNANEAHANATNSYLGYGSSFVFSGGDAEVWGGRYVEVTSNGTAGPNNDAGVRVQDFSPVPAGTQVTASAMFRAQTAGVQARFFFRDDPNNDTWASHIVPGDLPVGTWVRKSYTATVPAGRNLTDGYWVFHDPGAMTNGRYAGDIAEFCVREGSDGTFIPSTRVTGDIDLRFKGVVTELPTSETRLISKWNTAPAYALMLTPAGEVQIWAHDGTSGTFPASTGMGIAAGDFIDLRATIDFGANEVKFFRDGSQVGSTQSPAVSSISSSASAVGWGGEVNGTLGSPVTITSAEIRDGIDGPVVAQFDADDLERSRTNLLGQAAHLHDSTEFTGTGRTHLASGTLILSHPTATAYVYSTRFGDIRRRVVAADPDSVTFRVKVRMSDGSTPISDVSHIRWRFGSTKSMVVGSADADGFYLLTHTVARPALGWADHLSAGEFGLLVYTGYAGLAVEFKEPCLQAGTATDFVFPHGSGTDSMSGNVVGYYETEKARTLGSGVKGGTVSKGLLLPGDTLNHLTAEEENLLDSFQSGFENAPNATVTPEDRYEDWGYGGTTDNSVLGADSPLLFRPQDLGTEQSLYLTGESGNYASSPDVNLLDADTAHCERVGQWLAGGTGESSVLEPVQTFTPEFGSSHLKVDNATGATSDTSIFSNGFGQNVVSATEGEIFSFSIRMRSDSPHSIRLRARFELGGAFVSNPIIDTVSDASGGWVTLSGTATAPAGVDSVEIQIQCPSHPNGENIYWDAASIRKGIDPTFIPSTRVTGDIDLRAKVTPNQWTPATAEVILAKRGSGSTSDMAFEWSLQPAGTMVLAWSPDGVAVPLETSSASVPFSDEETGWVRVTLDVSTGDTLFYTSTDGETWTQLGATQTGTATSIQPVDAPVTFGIRGDGAFAPFHGALRHAEIRDGIDGPVVAQFDADDLERSRTNLIASGTTGFAGTNAHTGKHLGYGSHPDGHPSVDKEGQNTASYIGVAMGSTQRIPVTPGETIHASMEFNANTVTNYQGRIHFQWYDSSLSVISAPYVAATPVQDTWVTCSGSGVAPANAAFLQLYYRLDNTAAQNVPAGVTVRIAKVFASRTSSTYVPYHGSGVDSVSDNYIGYSETDSAKSLGAGVKGGTVSKGLLLPGVAGNHASTPDVNLLDADTAHLEQSVGVWRANLTGTRAPFLTSTRSPFGYLARVEHTASADNPTFVRVQAGSYSLGTAFSVKQNTTYTFSAYVKPDAGTDNMKLTAAVYDSTPTLITFHNATPDSQRTDEGWVHLTFTTADDPSVDHVLLLVEANKAANFADTEGGSYGALCFREGTSSDFIPSKKIKGDLDIRVRAQTQNWLAGDMLLSTGNHSPDFAGYELFIQTDGKVWGIVFDGTVQHNFASTANIPFSPGEDGWVRFTFTQNDGGGNSVGRIYTSTDGVAWTQLGADITKPAITPKVSGFPVSVGSRLSDSYNWQGAILSAEVRDGIDGLIVASFDSEDARNPDLDYETEVLALDPLVYYRLDDAASGTAVDKGSLGVNTTYTGAPAQATSSPLLTDDPALGMRTAGVSDHRVIRSGSTDLNSLTNFTVNVWVRPNALPGAGEFMDLVEIDAGTTPEAILFRINSNPSYSVATRNHSDELYSYGTFVGVGSPNDAQIGKAVMMTVTYDGQTVRTYFNGNIGHEHTTAPRIANLTTEPVSVEIVGTGNVSTQADFSDFSIWDKALSHSEIARLAAVGQAKWVDSDTNEPVVVNRHHAAAGTAEVATRATWNFTNGQSIHIPRREELDMADSEYAYVARLSTRPHDVDNTFVFAQGLVSSAGSSTPGYSLGFPANTTRFTHDVRETSLTYYATVSANEPELPPGVVGTIIGERDSNGAIYVHDGVLPAGYNTTGGSLANSEDLRIGGLLNDGLSYHGQLDMLAIFARTLTVGERTELANWDGTVANEPTWLRDLAVFYINADDDYLSDHYDGTLATNRIINLGSAKYGDFGWNMQVLPGGISDGTTYLDRYPASSLGPEVAYGDYVLRAVNSGAAPYNNNDIRVTSTPVGPVRYGDTYTFSMDILTNSSGQPPADIGLVWYDEDGEIGRSSTTIPTVNNISISGKFGRYSHTATAPKGATRVAGFFDRQDSGHHFYFDRACIRPGDSSTYIPTTRLRSDLDIRARIQPKDWVTGALWPVVTKWDNAPEGGYLLTISSTGRIRLHISTDGTDSLFTDSTASLPFGSREDGWVRAVLDVDDGAGNRVYTFYTSTDGVEWTQLGDPVTVAGAITIHPSTAALVLGKDRSTTQGGIFTEGAVLDVEVRDGINGPVVFEYSSEELEAVNENLLEASVAIPSAPAINYWGNSSNVAEFGTQPAPKTLPSGTNFATRLKRSSTGGTATMATRLFANAYQAAVRPGETVTMVAWVYTTVTRTVEMVSVFRTNPDGAATNGSPFIDSKVVTAGTWTKFVATGTVYSDAAYLTPIFNFLNTEPDEVHYIANVSVHYGTGDEFVMPNGSGVNSQGRTLAVHRAGDNRAEVVDRATWQFTSSEFLQLPNRDELVFNTSDFSVAVGFTQRAPRSTTWARLVSKESGASTGWTLATQPASVSAVNDPIYLFTSDGTNSASMNIGDMARIPGWQLGYGERVGDQITVGLDDIENSSTDIDGPINLNGTTPLRIGNHSEGTGNFNGQVGWAAVFSRALTSQERTDLGGWDGRVSNEPEWLRDLAIAYVNADDPYQADYYDGTLDTNRVLNLGSAAYGDFGWSVRSVSHTDEDATVNCQLINSNSAPPQYGDKTLYVFTNQVEGWRATTTPVGTVIPGGAYTASIDVLTNLASPNTEVGIVWYDADGEIGRDSTVNTHLVGGGGGANYGSWERAYHTGVAPTGATRAAVFVKQTAWAAFFIDRVRLGPGSSAEFAPTTRLLSDLDLRAYCQLKDWSNGSVQSLVGKWNSTGANHSYILQVNSTGNLRIATSSDGAETILTDSTAVVPFADQEAGWVRAVMTDNGATFRFYTSTDGIEWTQLGSDVTPVPARGIYGSSSSPMYVGSHNEGTSSLARGAVLSAEVRDGIGGPVVFDYSAEDMEASNENLLSPEYAIPTSHSYVEYFPNNVNAEHSFGESWYAGAGSIKADVVAATTGIYTPDYHTADGTTSYTVTIAVKAPVGVDYAVGWRVTDGAGSFVANSVTTVTGDGSWQMSTRTATGTSGDRYYPLVLFTAPAVGNTFYIGGFCDKSGTDTTFVAPNGAGVTPQGHTVVTYRSGDATAELVDRATWQFTGAERLALTGDVVKFTPDEEGLGIAASVHTRADENTHISHFSTNNSGDGFGAEPEIYFVRKITDHNIILGFSDGASTTSIGGGAGGTSYPARERTTVIAGVDADGLMSAYATHMPANGHVGPLGNGVDVDGLTINHAYIGTTASGTRGWQGTIDWYAVFARPLATSEKDDMLAWDGTVANEPVWLRDLAIFYINADDPWQADYYDGTLDTNRVLNLGAAKYGDFGWNLSAHGASTNDTLTSNLLLQSSGPDGKYGGKVARVADGASERWQITSTPVGPVTPGAPYTGSIDFSFTNAGTINVRVDLIWYDDDGEIGRDEGTLTPHTRTWDINTWTGATWKRASHTAVAPAGATRVAMNVFRNEYTWITTAFDRACIRAGTSSEWVPSMRIREDLDVRARIAPKKMSAASSDRTVVGRWGGGEYQWLLQVDDNGTANFYASSSGAAIQVARTEVALPYNDNEDFYLRATITLDSGAGETTTNIYHSKDGVSWTQIGSPLVTPTALASDGFFIGHNNTVTVGAHENGVSQPFVGAILDVEVMDGVSGPVVFKYDPDLAETSTDNLLESREALCETYIRILNNGDFSYSDGTSDSWGHVTNMTGNCQPRFYVDDGILVDNETYTFSIDVRNDGPNPVDVKVDWCDTGDSGIVTIQPGQTQRVSHSGSRVYDATYRFGDLWITYADGTEAVSFRNAAVKKGTDATWTAPHGTTTTTSGQTGLLVQSGSDVAYALQYPAWMMRGSPAITNPEYMTLNKIYKISEGSPYTIAGRAIPISRDLNPRLVDSGGYSTAGMYEMETFGGISLRNQDDSTVSASRIIDSDEAKSPVTSVAVFDGSQFVVYTNGTEGLTSTSVPSGEEYGIAANTIGGPGGSRGQSHGFYQWVAFWDRQLSDAEIEEVSSWDGSLDTMPKILNIAKLHVNADGDEQWNAWHEEIGKSKAPRLINVAMLKPSRGAVEMPAKYL